MRRSHLDCLCAASAGDVIYALNLIRLASVDDLRRALAPFRPGEPIVLQIERGGRLRYLVTTLR